VTVHQDEQRQDKLRRIPKADIQQAADPRSDTFCHMLGAAAHPLGERNDTQNGRAKHQKRGSMKPVLQQQRDRNKQQHQVENHWGASALLSYRCVETHKAVVLR